MKKAGQSVGNPYAPRAEKDDPFEIENKIIEIVLLEGFSPDHIKRLMRVAPIHVTKIRNKLIKEGKLKC